MNYKDVVDTQDGLSAMIGRVFVSVEGSVGADTLVFVGQDGTRFTFTHMQDCCESVEINDIVGDLQDLVDEPLLLAEETSNAEVPAFEDPEYHESYTWTFYKFATRKGFVDVRWLGESNGYYSERVDLFVDRM